jgi:CelD/BcsL family acetyltransferase involved in cellulose biosynthesis
MMAMDRIEIIRFDRGGLRAWEPAWRSLEQRAPDAAPFVCFDWLAAWADVYAPARLAVVRVGDGAEPLALGLVEVARGGRWRFAGRPVAGERGLLAEAAARDRAWRALGAWLETNPRRWATLETAGLPAAAASALPAGPRGATEVPMLTIPDSFEGYLAERPGRTRTRYRRALRRVAEEGAVLGPVADGEVGPALHDFVVLHGLRAASKGERHAAVDGRLERVLAALDGAPSVRLRVLELAHGGRRVGATVRLERPGGTWFYNSGFDPEAAWLAPGIMLALASIRDAIDHGISRIDLGAGAQTYKLVLGGVVEERFDVLAASRSPRGRLLGAAEAAYREARARVPVRTLARRLLGRGS